MHLLEHPLSSYAQTVKMMLREKGIEFTAEVPGGLGSGEKGGKLAEADIRFNWPAD